MRTKKESTRICRCEMLQNIDRKIIRCVLDIEINNVVDILMVTDIDTTG